MTNWVPISERLPTREDADERGEVVWKWADGTTCTGRFEDGGDEQDPAVAWHPLPRYTPPKPGPTNTECANILHYSALACMNHLTPKEDVPREEQFAMVRRWFANVMARIEREKPSPTDPVIDEREACAKIAQMVGDKKGAHSISYRSAAWEIRDLIRGRGANRA